MEKGMSALLVALALLGFLPAACGPHLHPGDDNISPPGDDDSSPTDDDNDDDNGQWQPMSLPTPALLSRIWGSSATDVYAVGYGLHPPYQMGVVFHYDGRSWSIMDAFSDDILGVWGSSAADVFAVGWYESTGGAIMHWDGVSWRGQYADATTWLMGVWGSSPSDVFAVGTTPSDDGSFAGVVLRNDGQSWSATDSSMPGAYLLGVWGSSAGDVYAIGQSVIGDLTDPAGLILHFDGASWSQTGYLAPGSYRDIWGSASSDVLAVGDSGVISHYDGSSWSCIESGTSDNIAGVWGSSSTDVFAVWTLFVGDDDDDAGGQTESSSGTAGFILHFTGSVWSLMPLDPVTPGLYGVWGSSATDVFAVGDGVILHYGG